MTPPKLSLCMIVKNEIEDLPGCLDSVSGLVDEVVIVDTGSSDGTVELARQRADRLVQVAWTDDFSAARNVSLDNAAGEWVLVLDADEVLDCPAGGAALREALDAPQVLAYQLRICNQLGEDQQGDHYLLRLFRRLPEIRFAGRIHEQIGDSLKQKMQLEPHWQLTTLEAVAIEHSGYEPEKFSRRGKKERNLHLLRTALAETPDDYYMHYKLSQELEDAPEARQHLFAAAGRLLDMPADQHSSHPIGDEVLTAAAQNWVQEGNTEQAIRACRSVLNSYTEHPATRLVLGMALLEQGLAEQARVELERCLQIPAPKHGFYFDQQAHELAAKIMLTRALRLGGAHQQALELLAQAQGEFPDEAKLIYEIMQTFRDSKQPLEAMKVGLQWFKQHPSDARCLALCADAADDLGQHEVANGWREKIQDESEQPSSG